MKDPVVIIGIGEIGSVFARGLLRCGHPVYPVTRDLPLAEAARGVPEPALVLVAVAERDLAAVLDAMPVPWRERLALIQNELLPADWRDRGLGSPTVMSVWFEKKPGRVARPILPSPVYGPEAGLLRDAMEAVGLPAQLLGDESELRYELVRKNLYILTTNIAGLRVGGSVGELWRNHRELAEAVAADVLDVQSRLAQWPELPRERLLEGMVAAFEGDPDHACMGRSAPARLARAIELADGMGLDVPTLRAIADQRD